MTEANGAEVEVVIFTDHTLIDGIVTESTVVVMTEVVIRANEVEVAREPTAREDEVGVVTDRKVHEGVVGVVTDQKAHEGVVGVVNEAVDIVVGVMRGNGRRMGGRVQEKKNKVATGAEVQRGKNARRQSEVEVAVETEKEGRKNTEEAVLETMRKIVEANIGIAPAIDNRVLHLK